MVRKPHHKKDYDNGDRRLREAAEMAWRSWFITDLVNVPFNDFLKDDIKSMCAMYDYPIELLGAEHSVAYTIGLCDVKELEMFTTDELWEAANSKHWRVKDLPFDNLGI